jgi:hypothetical protein
MNACLILSAKFLQKRRVFRLIFSEFNFVSATFVRNALHSMFYVVSSALHVLLSVKYFACFVLSLQHLSETLCIPLNI